MNFRLNDSFFSLYSSRTNPFYDLTLLWTDPMKKHYSDPSSICTSTARLSLTCGYVANVVAVVSMVTVRPIANPSIVTVRVVRS